ncbi:hypothetical protein Kpho02_72540 [Kitasatospora phosalacinea]|uniref:Uncharacterized protein n=1 Tax=Kitasatospora phosalacinea TaxID=2065 RepID=A0A9W6V770_9ACTN|nr:hypothetical protein Kpho02_72540 [Kitasatospora phosalacinea]
MAVYSEDILRHYRAFLAKRRKLRPSEEYRDPTAEEWEEFHKHFAKRKVELGTCGRGYGTPCAHEHARAARSYNPTPTRRADSMRSLPASASGSPRPTNAGGSAKGWRSASPQRNGSLPA